jgi:hypothetical protein
MWTLLIVSMVFATDDIIEPKVTRIAEYEYAWQCEDAWRQLSYELPSNETAWCEGPKDMDDLDNKVDIWEHENLQEDVREMQRQLDKLREEFNQLRNSLIGDGK